MKKNKRTLIIIDMQNDFIDGALKNDAAKAIVPGIVKLINSGDFDQIVCTLDTHKADYLSTVEGKNLPVPHCIKMTNGWLLNAEIKNALDEFELKHYNKEVASCPEVSPVVYIEKDTFGAKDLPYFINNYALDEAAFVGTCTGICVINNVAMLKATYPNINITVYEDLCACVTPESHSRAIEQMKFNHINIEKCGE